MATTTFRGWPPEAIDFYERLTADNTKAFWQANKSTYDEAVKAPFDRFSEQVADEFGPLRLFRPYRDVRFSKDKSPYKLAAGAATEGEGGEVYYVQLSADGMMAATGYYMLAKDQLERWRAAVGSDDTGPLLVEAVAAVEAAGLAVTSPDELKSAPRGWPKDHPRIRFLRMKGIAASLSWPPRKWMATKASADRVTEVWRNAAPLSDWLNEHVGPSELPPPEFG